MARLRYLVIGFAVLVVGCNRPQHEVAFTYDFLNKLPDGKVEVAGGGAATYAPGEGRGGAVEQALPNEAPDQIKQADGFAIRVESVSPTTAVLRVTLKDGSKTNLDLVPKVPREVFEASGKGGVRITVSEIRVRSK
jgi:hypothetical protein